MNDPRGFVIPDVQSSADTRQLAIDRVGIKNIRHPVRVRDKTGGCAAHGRPVQHVRAPAAQLQGHAHVALRRDPQRARARDLGGIVRAHPARNGAPARGRVRPHRDGLPLLRQQGSARVRRAEPDGLRGHLQRRHRPRRVSLHHEGRCASDQPVPVLQGHLRLRCA